MPRRSYAVQSAPYASEDQEFQPGDRIIRQADMRDQAWPVFIEVLGKAESAELRYGAFASTHEALGVALEEWDELRAAIHANKLGSVEMECIDLAAVLVRLAVACRGGGEFAKRSGK